MPKKDTQRKVLAVLAGGLVLGVGAAVTLAAWNDSEFATGTFTAGTFNLEGSTTGDVDADYADHATAGAAATLAFDLPTDVVSSMSPSDVVYAGFWVRLAEGTTTGATLAAAGTTASPAASSNAENLSYDVYQLAAGATCDATTAVGTPVASGATLDAQTGVTDITLVEGADATTPGAAVQLCFRVEAGTDFAQGLVTSATWEFAATSTN